MIFGVPGLLDMPNRCGVHIDTMPRSLEAQFKLVCMQLLSTENS